MDKLSAIKLMKEEKATARDEQSRKTEVEMENPQWFAVTKWSPWDIISVAEEQGVTLTEEQAILWLKKNERRFKEFLVKVGNEILADIDFKEEL